MKKLLIASTLLASFAASAANFVQLEQENVTGKNGGANSAATYLRVGKDVGNLSLGLQSRTARFDGGGIANSLEATLAPKGLSFLGLTPFAGVGHDFGNTGSSFNYGLVGLTASAKIGPGFVLTGVKTRAIRQNDSDPKQTVTFVSYNYPVAKNVNVNVGLSRSTQTINEKGVSLGISLGF